MCMLKLIALFTPKINLLPYFVKIGFLNQPVVKKWIFVALIIMQNFHL